MRARWWWQAAGLALVGAGNPGCDPVSPTGNGAVFCDVPVGTESRCTSAINAAATATPAAAAGQMATAGGTAGAAAQTGAAGTDAGAPSSTASGMPSTAGPAATGTASSAGTASGSDAGAAAPKDAGTEVPDGGLKCPNEVCQPIPPPSPDAQAMAAAMGVMFSIVNCCATGGDCGTSINGADCVRTPDSDPQCPMLEAMGFTVPSCCTDMGQCGIDGSAFMMGCTDLATVSAMASGFGITVPDPKACTPAKK